MGKFKKKESTHLVLKNEDILNALTDEELSVFAETVQKINKYRKETLKKDDYNYYIVNTDEPYAEKVFATIEEGENKKEDENEKI